MPEIDGLRGLAVSLVVFHHLKLLGGRGFLGVDIFFVVSGFVTLKILISDRYVSAKDFLIARFARLWPALSISLVTFFLIFNCFVMHVEYFPYLESIFLIRNFFSWGNATGHLWSIACEFQFYFLFALFFRIKLLQSKYLSYLLVFYLLVTSILELSISHPSMDFNKDGLFNLVFFRPSMILFGVLLGLHEQAIVTKFLNFPKVALFTTSTLIVATSLTRFPAFAGLSTCCLIVLSSPTARLSRILRIFGLFFSSKPLTYLGMYSYSIYLWHLPLILLLNRFWSEGSPNLFEFFIILSLVALLSFNFVEKPLQSRILKRWVNTSNRRSPSNS